jgi:hypothetical protein
MDDNINYPNHDDNETPGKEENSEDYRDEDYYRNYDEDSQDIPEITATDIVVKPVVKISHEQRMMKPIDNHQNTKLGTLKKLSIFRNSK